jgi:hypothetical protein
MRSHFISDAYVKPPGSRRDGNARPSRANQAAEDCINSRPRLHAETIRLSMRETDIIRAATESSLIFLLACPSPYPASPPSFHRAYQNVLGILLTLEPANVIFPPLSIFCSMLNHTSIEKAGAELIAEERPASTRDSCIPSYPPAIFTTPFGYRALRFASLASTKVVRCTFPQDQPQRVTQGTSWRYSQEFSVF